MDIGNLFLFCLATLLFFVCVSRLFWTTSIQVIFSCTVLAVLPSLLGFLSFLCEITWIFYGLSGIDGIFDGQGYAMGMLYAIPQLIYGVGITIVLLLVEALILFFAKERITPPSAQG